MIVRLEAGDVYRPIATRVIRLDSAGQPVIRSARSSWAASEGAVRPEHRAVMERVAESPAHQVAVIGEGFCPRCGCDLGDPPRLTHLRGTAWCSLCWSGWSVARRHGDSGWWVSLSEWDETGREVSRFGWRYP